jgi:predicted nucleotidyltransferase
VTIATFSSFEEADNADRKYYAGLTPTERLKILLDLTHPTSFRPFIELLNSKGVEYVIVGGFALAFHGRPRYTGDIDFLIRSTAENAGKLAAVLAEFGFASLGLTVDDLVRPDSIVQLGYPPNRIDLLTSLSGVDAESVWEARVEGELDGLPIHFIGREELIRNKRASGRAQDRADLEALGGE